MKNSSSDKFGVYIIMNIKTKSVYVGGTMRSFRKRWKEHRIELNANKHGNPYLQNAWNKYGSKSFYFLIVEQVDSPKDVVCKEQYWLDWYNNNEEYNLYNICPNAYSPAGREVKPETRLKLSNSTKKMFTNLEMRQHHSDGISKAYSSPEGKMLASQKARAQWQSLEKKEKLSRAARAYGAKPEVKQRRSEAARKMMADPKRREMASRITKARMSTPKGKIQIIEANKKRWSDPQEKERLSERGKKQWMNSEYRQRMIKHLEKTYDGFISPDGTVYQPVINLKEFCILHGLTESAMHHVYRGKRKSHKGWTRYYPDGVEINV